jgi:hypothetical protein
MTAALAMAVVMILGIVARRARPMSSMAALAAAVAM